MPGRNAAANLITVIDRAQIPGAYRRGAAILTRANSASCASTAWTPDSPSAWPSPPTPVVTKTRDVDFQGLDTQPMRDKNMIAMRQRLEQEDSVCRIDDLLARLAVAGRWDAGGSEKCERP